MKLFSKKQKRSDIKIVLDIRSSSIGAAVVTQAKDEDPIIHWTNRVRVFPETSGEVNALIVQTYKQIDNVLQDVVIKGIPAISGVNLNDRSIDEVCCAFASPWYESKIKNFEVKGKGEIHFTKEYFNKVLNKEHLMDKVPSGRVQIDKKILSVLMNGYETDDPFDKKADHLILSFYSSFVSKKTKDDLEHRIKKYLHTKRIVLSTHPLATISAIKSIFNALSNFVLIDVGGEITDIALFKKSMLHSLVTVPHGINFFIREVSEKCSIDRENAISQLNAVCDDRFDKKCIESTTAIVENAKTTWLSKIKETVDREWQGETVPPTIFVTVDNEAQSLMKKLLLSKESYIDTLKINREPILHIINTNTVKELCQYGKEVKHDALLSVITNYFVNI